MANETLSQAYLKYKDYLEAQGWAENTIKNKLQVLHHAKATWHNPIVRRIQPADVNRYFAYQDWNERTRNLYLGGLRAFFKFCRETSITPPDHDPTIGWRMLREPDSQMFWIPPVGVQRADGRDRAPPRPDDRGYRTVRPVSGERGTHPNLRRRRP